MKKYGIIIAAGLVAISNKSGIEGLMSYKMDDITSVTYLEQLRKNREIAKQGKGGHFVYRRW